MFLLDFLHLPRSNILAPCLVDLESPIDVSVFGCQPHFLKLQAEESDVWLKKPGENIAGKFPEEGQHCFIFNSLIFETVIEETLKDDLPSRGNRITLHIIVYLLAFRKSVAYAKT